jgi:HK97 family phage prohead protease
MTKFVSAAQFKFLHRRSKKPAAAVAGVGVYKIMESPAMTVPDDARALRFVISSGMVDRERDIIDPKGWDLEWFRRNPVVLWAHNYEAFPVGKANDVDLVDGKLMATVRFLPSDMPLAGPVAEAVYRMAKDGWLAATSVGFRPLEWAYTSDKDRGADDWFPGVDFYRQELVEFSIVTVPANPEALIEAPPETAGDGPDPAAPLDPDLTPAAASEAALAASRARRRRIFALARLG